MRSSTQVEGKQPLESHDKLQESNTCVDHITSLAYPCEKEVCLKG